MAVDRFGRDPGTADILRYYDQPERCRWDLLTDKEAKVLHDEIRKCSDPDTGFPWISKNYYWITTKDGSDTLLRFRETQEMVWETIRLLRLRGRGVKLLIIKARQLYISTLIAAYIAFLSQFNPNNRGLVVSYDEEHAADLFSKVLHIYDQLPWWLRPMVGSRKYEQGIHLINPDPELRRLEPGMNSNILVQGAKQYTGIAEGRTINSALVSELGSMDPDKARKIIMGDFRWALPDSPTTTAVIETRVQQASRFLELLWESQVEAGDDADWHPIFIPIYFDKSHFVAPRAGWKPDKAEVAVKERAAEEWCVCSDCGQIRPATFGGASMDGVPCRDCKAGYYTPYILQDGQMRWLEQRRINAQPLGESAIAEMQQSLATNPQEAFAHVTETVFSQKAREWVAQTTRPGYLACGYMVSDGTFHGPRVLRRDENTPKDQHGEESAQCWASGCKEDHRGDTNRYLKIWQFPLRGAKYSIGVDPSQGLGGMRDFSVVWVNKISCIPEPDIQVAIYRCNTISTWDLAAFVNTLGRWYNNALVTTDYQPPTTGDRLLNYFRYPNLYQWLNLDAFKQRSNRFHWVWNSKNKDTAWQVLDGWLRDHSLITKDPVFAKELRHFQRHKDGSLGAPDSAEDDGLGEDFERIHDDTISAAMLALIPAHQQDPRRPADLGVPQEDGLRGPGEWLGKCTKCDKSFEAQAPCERERCPFCGSIWLRWSMPKAEGRIGVGHNAVLGFKFDDMAGTPGPVRDRYGASEEWSFGAGGMNQE